MEYTLKLNSNIKNLIKAYNNVIGIQSNSNKTKNIEYLLSEVNYETIKRKQDRQQSTEKY